MNERASVSDDQEGDSAGSDSAIPVVIYASRSQAEEEDKDSTGDQIAIIRERLDREPDRLVYGTPHADHASGYHGNRGPGLEAAIRDAARAVNEHGRAEIWVFKSERLGRGSGRKDEARCVMELYVECRRAGIDLRSVDDDAFLTNPMLVGVADEMAHQYSRDLSAHVKRGISSRVRKGLPWGEPAYGYARGEGATGASSRSSAPSSSASFASASSWRAPTAASPAR